MIRDFLSRLMYGRYGTDPLNLSLMGGWLVCYLLSVVFRIFRAVLFSNIFSLLGYACLIFELFRMFSRNYDRRRRENDWFMDHAGPVIRGLRQKRAQMMDRDHRYFRCPSCGQVLRVPKGKGKVNIRCRNCGCGFQKKT